MTSPPAPLRVGLVGAGPWASECHAPMLAAGPDTTLAGVWARRPEAAQALAAEYDGVPAVGSFEELLDRCEAVAFAVPPDVQAELAPRAAAAGRHLLLEKPLSLDLDAARRLADAVDEAGVGSLLMVRNRFTEQGARFVESAGRTRVHGGQGHYVTDVAVGDGPFRTPWRVERGGVLDLGPHLLDLLDAGIGPVVDLRAQGSAQGLVTLTTEHEGGQRGQAALSIHAAGGPGHLWVELFTEAGPVTYDGRTAEDGPHVLARIAARLAAAARGQAHPLDVHRGLHLQRLIDLVLRDLARQ